MRGGGRTSRRALAVVGGASALVLGVTSAASAAPRPGAPGLGDAYYPTYGNGGYDVRHYRLAVDYDPADDLLTGRATISARATQDLSRFDLDFGLRTQSVKVNGKKARFHQDGLELVVTPRRPVRKGHSLKVVVTYAGVPSAVTADGYSPW